MKSQPIYKATPNYSKRTFTIRKYYPGGGVTKFRTGTMSNQEFQDNLNNTSEDWMHYIHKSGNVTFY